MDAFPVFVSAEYLKRELAYKPIEKKVMEREEKVEREEWEEEVGQEEITRFIERKEAKIGYTKNKYSTPDDFSPPSLLEKMIYAFFFVIPSYFAIQVFSSSLIEDRIARRIDTVLSTPVSEIEFLLGKMIPYTVFSLIAVVLVSLIFKENILAVIFVLPIILLFSSLQMFLALISRSYREMTFLVTVSSLLLTAYIFIPSVFAGTIPVSKVSPITLMFDFFENEPIEMREYLFATFQFYAMAFVLIYLSSKALNPEIMHSSSDILRRLFMVIERVVRKDYHTFFASIASIPFIFMLEFLLLSVLFILPPKSSIPIFLGIVAFVEESFKGSAVFAAFRNGASLYRAAIFCSLGFFAGEKLIIMLNIVTQYNNLFLAQYLILPLFIHLTSLLLFATIVRRSFIAALIAASFLHFAYNYVVVV
jgi:ABC-type Na+ efflux pump permease subunit